MKLPKLGDLKPTGKRVIVRADLDIDEQSSERLKVLIPTLDFLQRSNCEITIIGHKGRPGGKIVDELSLEPISKLLEGLLIKKWGVKKVKDLKMFMMENLRFDKGEEENSSNFSKHLANKGDFYVNEAFANSHRKHASIVGLPKLMPHAAGFHFADEVENLSKITKNHKRPLVIILGGMKEDKLNNLPDIEKLADKILVGGRLPDYLGETRSVRNFSRKDKVIVGNLIMDKEDITLHSIERFKDEIKKAKTIVLAGPMGKFEEEGHIQGTREIFEAVVANRGAFKVAGGGDTDSAISALSLVEEFDWISVGGGAMLEFLAKGTLPGIKALMDEGKVW